MRLRRVAAIALTTCLGLPVAALGTTVVAGTPVAAAVPTDLFFSEYIEGSSFNKAVEIFNGTGAPVDLAAGGYMLELYSNGSATVSQMVALAGTVADGDVFVVSRADADPLIVAQTDQLAPAVANWNGDDAVVLRKAGAPLDVIGQIGVDPGTEWGTGLT
ncbi:MAG TPA: lamin tail domain-containing protein, partial [Acidimicrobiales bacterium]|nr:lamin tail domain-containing protein [Acidimicrobiales bacterium]